MDPQADQRTFKTQCCIVGGGPAGMMLGYLLARAGVETLVLEKHADFLRDFRGDTVHPSTMQIMHELGLLDEFLKRPHQRIDRIGGDFGGTMLRMADFSRLKVAAPFIAMMPQWDFLDFLADQATAFPAFKLLRETSAHDLLQDGEKITGVIAKDGQGDLRIIAAVTIGCDGRHSTIRARAGLKVEDIGAPIDVLWFRVAKSD
ncbi:MAG: FAD-dependent oxidoreductase, partial [Hyphomicrobiales bacterium]